jgi:hypothetical protein
MEQLLEFPDRTLGKDLALYLRRKGFRFMPSYLSHDCKHILLEYEMDETGEACMQFYFFGNRHYSAPVLLTVGLCTLLMPEHWKKFRAEFRKGRSRPPFPKREMETALKMDTATLRQLIVNNFKYQHS